MVAPRALRTVGWMTALAVLVVPLAAIWLSGRFGAADRDPGPPTPAVLATLPRRETTTPPAPHPTLPPGSAPVPAPPVTVGPGAVTVPAPVAGAAAVPTPREGQVVNRPTAPP